MRGFWGTISRPRWQPVLPVTEPRLRSEPASCPGPPLPSPLSDITSVPGSPRGAVRPPRASADASPLPTDTSGENIAESLVAEGLASRREGIRANKYVCGRASSPGKQLRAAGLRRWSPAAGCTGLSLGAVALSRSCRELVAPEGSQLGAGRSPAVPTVPAAPRGPLLEGCCAGAINTGGTLFPSCVCWAGSSPVSLPKTVPGTLGCFPCSVFSRTACKQVHGVNSVRCQGQGRGALCPGSPLQEPRALSGPAPCLSGDTVPVPVPSHPLTPSWPLPGPVGSA